MVIALLEPVRVIGSLFLLVLVVGCAPLGKMVGPADSTTNSNPGQNSTDLPPPIIDTSESQLKVVATAETAPAMRSDLYAEPVAHIFPSPSGNQFTRFGDLYVFNDYSSDVGMEPRLLNLSSGQSILLKDIYSGPRGSYASHFTVSGSQFFFFARDNLSARELWVSDGTSMGTHLVKDMGESSSPTIGGISPVGSGLVVFSSTNDSDRVSTLYVSDGTQLGTYSLRTRDGDRLLDPSNFRSLPRGLSFFSARTSFTSSPKLFRTDGSAQGTFAVSGLNPDEYFSNASFALALNDRLIFQPQLVGGGTSSRLLGTDGGAAEILSTSASLEINGLHTWALTRSQQFLFSSGVNILRTDGSLSGTSMVGSALGSVIRMTGGLGTFIYFTALEANGIRGAYRYDGFQIQRMGVDAWSQQNSYSLSNSIVLFDGRILSSAHLAGSSQFDLILQNDLSSPLQKTLEADPSPVGLNPQYFFSNEDSTYFVGRGGRLGVNLYRLDRNASLPVMVKNLNWGFTDMTNTYFARGFFAAGARSWYKFGPSHRYFSVENPSSHYFDLPLDPANSNSALQLVDSTGNGPDLVDLQNKFFVFGKFSSENHYRILKSNGTPNGTQFVAQYFGADIGRVGDKLIFKNSDDADRSATPLSAFDLNSEQTEALQVPALSIENASILKISHSFILASEHRGPGQNVFSLWRSNGSSAGTLKMGELGADTNRYLKFVEATEKDAIVVIHDFSTPNGSDEIFYFDGTYLRHLAAQSSVSFASSSEGRWIFGNKIGLDTFEFSRVDRSGVHSIQRITGIDANSYRHLATFGDESFFEGLNARSQREMFKYNYATGQLMSLGLIDETGDRRVQQIFQKGSDLFLSTQGVSGGAYADRRQYLWRIHDDTLKAVHFDDDSSMSALMGLQFSVMRNRIFLSGNFDQSIDFRIAPGLTPLLELIPKEF